MSEAIIASFVPARAHIKEQPRTFERFAVQWTPTQLVLEPDGKERHRTEGFLPVDDFLAQLHLGLAKLDSGRQQYGEAVRRFRSVYEMFPTAGAAPEACYWVGVSAYKNTRNPEPLTETARLLKSKYPDSKWTRKASVWSS